MDRERGRLVGAALPEELQLHLLRGELAKGLPFGLTRVAVGTDLERKSAAFDGSVLTETYAGASTRIELVFQNGLLSSWERDMKALEARAAAEHPDAPEPEPDPDTATPASAPATQPAAAAAAVTAAIPAAGTRAAGSAAAGSPGTTAPAQPAGEPCQRARDEAEGAPLAKAFALLGKPAPRPANGAFWKDAVESAEKATTVAPSCFEAWAALAFARYRFGYDICGRGNLAGAEAAARKATELAGADPGRRRVAWMHMGRIASAQNKWDEARKSFEEALKAVAGHREAQNWLSDLSVRASPSSNLVAAAKKVLAGQALADADTAPLTRAEVGFLTNAPSARHGRRMNVGALDWFFYCEGSPLAERPSLNPAASSNPVKRGTIDWDNQQYLARVRATKR